MKTKMRISLLDKNLVVIEDRLVDQATEFMGGAKVKHEGPIKFEVTLMDKDDIAKFQTYIEQLAGNLPLPERKVYKSGKKSTPSLLDEDHLRDFVKEFEKKCTTIDQLIKYLRERNFKFVTAQFLEDKKFLIKLKEEHKSRQFMIRCIRENKNPNLDKFDPQLVLGIVLNRKVQHVKVYLHNEFIKTIKINWEEKSDINFKKIVLTKFPAYMILEEREKYRMEEAKYKLNPELPKSKFFMRWEPAVLEANKK